MGNNKKSRIRFGVIILLTLVISFTGGFFTHYLLQSKTIRKINDVLTIIEKNSKSPYGEDLDFDSDEITKQFVEAILSNDNYAKYFTHSEYEKEENEGKGNYIGIGVSLYSDQPIIYKVIGNSPAESAGLKPNDEILKAKKSGGEYREFESTSSLTEYLKGLKEGDVVDFLVKREGEENKEYSIRISEYIASYVKYYDNQCSIRFVSELGQTPKLTKFSEEKLSILDDKTAFIQFESFEGSASTQLDEVLKYFYESGKSKLIFDLRDNGGGYMSTLLDVAPNFIYNNGSKKSLITRVEGRDYYADYSTKTRKFNTQLKDVVVLANSNTASASECLIGAMLCYGDANFSMDKLLISYNSARQDFSTFGKGIMQTTYTLPSGGALKLTTAKLFQPDLTTCIHGVGIKQTNELNQVTDSTALLRAVEILSAS